MWKNIKRLFFFGALITFTSCIQRVDKTEPTLSWDFAGTAHPSYLADEDCKNIAGHYSIESAKEQFGKSALIQSACNSTSVDSSLSLTIMTESGTGFYLQARLLDSLIILNGYWKSTFGSGLARFIIYPEQGGKSVLENLRQPLEINGVFGFGDDSPVRPVTFIARR